MHNKRQKQHRRQKVRDHFVLDVRDWKIVKLRRIKRAQALRPYSHPY
ncbi:MAG: hypothetical protein H0X30_09395 [Anaerolineae bacterium]|nr:hypothetical protein [Anaerolineae bacterium]